MICFVAEDQRGIKICWLYFEGAIVTSILIWHLWIRPIKWHKRGLDHILHNEVLKCQTKASEY